MTPFVCAVVIRFTFTQVDLLGNFSEICCSSFQKVIFAPLRVEEYKSSLHGNSAGVYNGICVQFLAAAPQSLERSILLLKLPVHRGECAGSSSFFPGGASSSAPTALTEGVSQLLLESGFIVLAESAKKLSPDLVSKLRQDIEGSVGRTYCCYIPPSHCLSQEAHAEAGSSFQEEAAEARETLLADSYCCGGFGAALLSGEFELSQSNARFGRVCLLRLLRRGRGCGHS